MVFKCLSYRYMTEYVNVPVFCPERLFPCLFLCHSDLFFLCFLSLSVYHRPEPDRRIKTDTIQTHLDQVWYLSVYQVCLCIVSIYIRLSGIYLYSSTMYLKDGYRQQRQTHLNQLCASVVSIRLSGQVLGHTPEQHFAASTLRRYSFRLCQAIAQADARTVISIFFGQASVLSLLRQTPGPSRPYPSDRAPHDANRKHAGGPPPWSSTSAWSTPRHGPVLRHGPTSRTSGWIGLTAYPII